VNVDGGGWVRGFGRTPRDPLLGMLTYWVIDTVAVELGEWLGGNASVHITASSRPRRTRVRRDQVTADSCN
jgi:hypothetical protein